jgi:AhpD family alkylhydroperoxidase
MEIDEMVQYLVAIGASIGADCKPCLQSCIALARQCGADEQDIEAAMAVGRKVKGCAEKTKRPAGSLKEDSPAAEYGSASCCGSVEINTQEGRSQ